MTTAEAQRKAILSVMRSAAHGSGQLPRIKDLAEVMQIPVGQFHDRLAYLCVNGTLTSDTTGVYCIDGMPVKFGKQRLRKPKKPAQKRKSHSKPVSVKYESYVRACLCCGSEFMSERLHAEHLTTPRTVYRLCATCRSGGDKYGNKNPLYDVTSGSLVDDKSTVRFIYGRPNAE